MIERLVKEKERIYEEFDRKTLAKYEVLPKSSTNLAVRGK